MENIRKKKRDREGRPLSSTQDVQDAQHRCYCMDFRENRGCSPGDPMSWAVGDPVAVCHRQWVLTYSLTKGSEYPLASMAARCTQRTMPTIRPPCWVLYMRDTRILPRSSTSPPRSTCKGKQLEIRTQAGSRSQAMVKKRQNRHEGDL